MRNRLLAMVVAAATGAILATAPASAAPAKPADNTVSVGRHPQIAVPRTPWIGSYTPGGIDGLDDFNATTRVSSNTMMFFKNWKDHARFDPVEYRKANSRGVWPIISWEPGKSGYPYQPDYTLANIISGKYDTLIAQWADGIRDLKFPVGLRFAHEMNGDWYPWATQANGGSPAQYIAAWRHVHDIFDRRGATNAVWIWSPNVIRYTKSAPLRTMYPGDGYVDIVGLVGYGSHKGETFDSTFGSSLTEIRKFTERPVLLTETAVGGSASDSAYLRSFFDGMIRHRDIIGLVYFNDIKREDWRVDKTPTRLSEFTAGASRYLRTWRPPAVTR